MLFNVTHQNKIQHHFILVRKTNIPEDPYESDQSSQLISPPQMSLLEEQNRAHRRFDVPRLYNLPQHNYGFVPQLKRYYMPHQLYSSHIQQSYPVSTIYGKTIVFISLAIEYV